MRCDEMREEEIERKRKKEGECKAENCVGVVD